MNLRVFGRRSKDQPASGPMPAVPTPFLLRRDKTLRFRRGGAVYCTDGRVGTLERIVVDEAAGAITELAVRPVGGRRAVVVPTDLVAMTADGGVFLRENRERFAERIAASPAFDRRRFTAANRRTLVTNGGRTGQVDPRRGVVRAGRDFVETPTVVPPTPGERRSVPVLEAIG